MATPTNSLDRAAKPFELVAGHPALDFINALDNRFSPNGSIELLNTYGDLLRFTHQAGLLSDSRLRKLKRADFTAAERSQTLLQAKKLRESLASVAYALADEQEVPEDELFALESHFKQAAAQRHLEIEDGQIQWRWKGLTRHAEAPLWLLSQSAAELLLSGQLDQLRTCSSDTCRWLFLDTSKNHSRRWCDMRVCGNRSKARNFHLRRSSAAKPALAKNRRLT